MSTWASPTTRRLRRIVAMGTLVVVGILVAVIVAVKRPSSSTTIVESTTHANLFGATASAQTRASIVSFAQGQVGYSTDPAGTYCNKFSAYWYAGSSHCGTSNRDAQWCAVLARGARDSTPRGWAPGRGGGRELHPGPAWAVRGQRRW